MTTSDTTQTITTTTSRAALWCAIGAGLAGTFLAGILLATSLGDYGVGLSRTGWDLARGGAITCGIIAVLAAMTWWAVDQVLQRLAQAADRNRDATLAMVYRLDQMEAALAEIVRESRTAEPPGVVQHATVSKTAQVDPHPDAGNPANLSAYLDDAAELFELGRQIERGLDRRDPPDSQPT